MNRRLSFECLESRSMLSANPWADSQEWDDGWRMFDFDAQSSQTSGHGAATSAALENPHICDAALEDFLLPTAVTEPDGSTIVLGDVEAEDAALPLSESA